MDYRLLRVLCNDISGIWDDARFLKEMLEKCLPPNSEELKYASQLYETATDLLLALLIRENEEDMKIYG